MRAHRQPGPAAVLSGQPRGCVLTTRQKVLSLPESLGSRVGECPWVQRRWARCLSARLPTVLSAEGNPPRAAGNWTLWLGGLTGTSAGGSRDCAEAVWGAEFPGERVASKQHTRPLLPRGERGTPQGSGNRSHLPAAPTRGAGMFGQLVPELPSVLYTESVPTAPPH